MKVLCTPESLIQGKVILSPKLLLLQWCSWLLCPWAKVPTLEFFWKHRLRYSFEEGHFSKQTTQDSRMAGYSPFPCALMNAVSEYGLSDKLEPGAQSSWDGRMPVLSCHCEDSDAEHPGRGPCVGAFWGLHPVCSVLSGMYVTSPRDSNLWTEFSAHFVSECPFETGTGSPQGP